MIRHSQSAPQRTLDAGDSYRKAPRAAPDPEAQSRFENEGGRQSDERELRLGTQPNAQSRAQSDNDIRTDVSRCLEEGFVDALGIGVSVEGGVVTLAGTVNDSLRRQVAEDIARTRPGVVNVNNKLRVRKK